MWYLKTTVDNILNKFCEKKSFNQTMRFVFEKLPENWGFVISRRLYQGSN